MSPMLSRKMLLTLAGRLLVGYLLFRFYNRSRVEAASLEANGNIGNATCTMEGIEEFLSEHKGNDEAIRATWELCTEHFLANNQVSGEVKRTVDEWIGLDLSNADANEVFLAYQLAIVSPKPENTSDLFAADCEQMFESFEAYRDIVEPLTYYYGSGGEENLNRMLGPQDNKELERRDEQLINFVQYTQLCKSLLQGDDYDYDGDGDDDDQEQEYDPDYDYN